MTLDLFGPARQGLMTGEIDIDTATIRIGALRGYTYNVAHKFVSDVTGASGVIVASVVLANKSVDTTGVFDNTVDITFPSVAAGAAITALLYYQSSAVGGGADVATSAQRLIMFDNQATNLPITPNGGNLDVTFDSGANKIFAF